MRFAYADPPYPGQAYKYRDHPDYGGEVDHAELVARLEAQYPDGWALSTSAMALPGVLALCQSGVSVAIWHNTSAEPPGNRPNRWWYCWEPVIVHGGRPTPIRSLLACGRPSRGLVGAKPKTFCRWVFGLLGAQPGDELDDLFPGSGAVAEAWREYQSQPWLEPPRTRRLDSKEQRRALRLAGAETLI